MIAVDAVVLGAGPAGAAAAIALRGAGRSVLLLERVAGPAGGGCEHLPGSARALLDRLDLDPRRIDALATPCRAVASAWERAALGESSSLRDPFGAGWLLDRARFDALLAGEAERRGALRRRVRDLPEVVRSDGGFRVLFGGARRAATARDPFPVDGAHATATAALLVDARGCNAPPLAATGARRVRRDRLVGVVARLATTTRPAPVLLIEAAERGWWYAAPFPDGTLAAAWMTDADLLAADGGAAAAFATQLARSLHLAARAGAAPFGRLRVRNAASSALEPAAGPGWASVGAAAAAHDPLAARGLLHALSSGLEAAQALCDGDPQLAARAAARFARFLDERAAIYRRVRRWPDAPFWRRRAPSLPAAPVGEPPSSPSLTAGA